MQSSFESKVEEECNECSTPDVAVEDLVKKIRTVGSARRNSKHDDDAVGNTWFTHVVENVRDRQ